MTDRLPPAFGTRQRLGELVALLLVWLGGTVVLSSLLAPGAFGLVEAIAPGRFPFRRVLRRLAMLVAIVLLVVLRRRFGVRSWADLGLARSAARWRACGVAAAVGVATIAVLLVTEVLFGTRVVNFGLTPGEAIEALFGAAAIGLVEEALCRGALLFPFGRLQGWLFWAANAMTSAIYATAHFARGGGRSQVVDWTSGWRVWGDLGPAVTSHAAAWWGLASTGALFYALAWRQGHVWGAVGLHAGAVLALQLGGGLSDAAAGDRSLFLVDGLLPGYPLAALAGIVAIWLWWGGRRRAA